LEYNETVNQLFIDFEKTYDSVRRGVLYSILVEFGVSMTLVRLINICLNQMYSGVHIGKHLCDNFCIQNDLIHGDALLPLPFIFFASEYAIRKVRENLVGLKLNGTHQLLAYADDVYLLGDDIDTLNKEKHRICN
jgi:hypothetical protein